MEYVHQMVGYMHVTAFFTSIFHMGFIIAISIYHKLSEQSNSNWTNFSAVQCLSLSLWIISDNGDYACLVFA